MLLLLLSLMQFLFPRVKRGTENWVWKMKSLIIDINFDLIFLALKFKWNIADQCDYNRLLFFSSKSCFSLKSGKSFLQSTVASVVMKKVQLLHFIVPKLCQLIKVKKDFVSIFSFVIFLFVKVLYIMLPLVFRWKMFVNHFKWIS